MFWYNVEKGNQVGFGVDTNEILKLLHIWKCLHNLIAYNILVLIVIFLQLWNLIKVWQWIISGERSMSRSLVKVLKIPVTNSNNGGLMSEKMGSDFIDYIISYHYKSLVIILLPLYNDLNVMNYNNVNDFEKWLEIYPLILST